MGALTIAFDITMVGVLALPWVLLVVHLYFSAGESRVERLLDWVKDANQPAAVAVVLFALTYTLGSAVSRVAHDFFNDDDLHFHITWQRLRVGVTEDRIRTSVYCKTKDDYYGLRAQAGDDALAAKIDTFRSQGTELCWQVLNWRVSTRFSARDEDLNGTAQDIFGLQENKLLLQGETSTLKLRQLHDQIMVLRGASFSGVVAFSLCLFAWCATVRLGKPRSRRGIAVMVVPALYLVLAAIAAYNHYSHTAPPDPPYMEFTLLLLGAAGIRLMWSPPPRPLQPREEELRIGGRETRHGWQEGRWGLSVLLSALVTLALFMGWWSTEVLYGEQVLYSYNSLGGTSKQK